MQVYEELLKERNAFSDIIDRLYNDHRRLSANYDSLELENRELKSKLKSARVEVDVANKIIRYHVAENEKLIERLNVCYHVREIGKRMEQLNGGEIK